ncbi:MAG: VTT domain-containing protein [Pseudomonadota bacterium]
MFIWLAEPENLSGLIEIAGPVAVVVLLALAVVVSPIPSGPIAMAAGAYLGTFEGGVYTAIGAVLGATIAFSLSRWLGYRPLANSSFPLAKWITRARTQNTLAVAVLVSRLIPFISFDAVSYVAGLTTITFRNFVISTTLGVMPASFAFAALGAGMATHDNATLLIVACTITLVLPLVCFFVQRLRKS